MIGALATFVTRTLLAPGLMIELVCCQAEPRLPPMFKFPFWSTTSPRNVLLTPALTPALTPERVKVRRNYSTARPRG